MTGEGGEGDVVDPACGLKASGWIVPAGEGDVAPCPRALELEVALIGEGGEGDVVDLASGLEAGWRIVPAREGDGAPCLRALELEVALTGEGGEGDVVGSRCKPLSATCAPSRPRRSSSMRALILI